MKTLKKAFLMTFFMCLALTKLVAGSELKEHNSKLPKYLSCLQSLQLDDKQRSEIMEIYDSHKSQVNNLRVEIGEKTGALKKAIESGDEHIVRKAFQEVSKLRENMLILKLSILKDVKNVLSDDQKNQFNACLKEQLEGVQRKWEKALMRFLSE
ncbi:MAG: Spy/CpxP family protein refolding chaperone [Syntrophobacterales bacterium]|nr:Spy/CpxP family protein refolding chaperone [Syntrophobacterales bacterium]